MAIHEFTFSVDDFMQPKVVKDAEAVQVLLTRLLLLEPGTFQSHPDMGVGLISRFRYGVEGTASKLQSEFQRQIEKYLPQFQGARVAVQEGDGTLFISAEIDDTLYGIYYEINTSKVTTKHTKLANL